MALGGVARLKQQAGGWRQEQQRDDSSNDDIDGMLTQIPVDLPVGFRHLGP